MVRWEVDVGKPSSWPTCIVANGSNEKAPSLDKLEGEDQYLSGPLTCTPAPWHMHTHTHNVEVSSSLW